MMYFLRTMCPLMCVTGSSTRGRAAAHQRNERILLEVMDETGVGLADWQMLSLSWSNEFNDRMFLSVD